MIAGVCVRVCLRFRLDDTCVGPCVVAALCEALPRHPRLVTLRCIPAAHCKRLPCRLSRVRIACSLKSADEQIESVWQPLLPALCANNTLLNLRCGGWRGMDGGNGMDAVWV